MDQIEKVCTCLACGRDYLEGNTIHLTLDRKAWVCVVCGGTEFQLYPKEDIRSEQVSYYYKSTCNPYKWPHYFENPYRYGHCGLSLSWHWCFSFSPELPSYSISE